MNPLNIFYDNIIPEAMYGRINSFFYYNIVFSTFLYEDNVKFEAKMNYDDLLIPTLYIKDKKQFNDLLIEYVSKCLSFYGDDNFPTEILSGETYDKLDKISREKTILALLFANATFEDFSNPINFLRKRLSFFSNTEPCKYNLGYSNVLDCNLQVEISKDIINNETPYQFIVRCIDSNGDVYELPKLKFGICDNKAYVYAIQNVNNSENSFSKKINRKLYKIGEGFSKKSDNYEIYGIGNLNDITPSFLVVANIFVSYISRLGINNLVISSILIEGWNAKVISNNLKSEKGLKSYDKYYDKQITIQFNLTEKFLRTFLRLTHHYNNLNVITYPGEQTSDLCILNFGGKFLGNNTLLNETAAMMSDALIYIDEKKQKNKN